MDKWMQFFLPYFKNQAEARVFVDACESINRDYCPPDELDNCPAKIMMHQTVRLVDLSRSILTLDGVFEPLSLFFIIVCAECVAKLFDNYTGDEDSQKNRKKDSKKYVCKFFKEHVSQADRVKLCGRFRRIPHGRLSYDEIIHLLYAIRCDVVHEGNWWRFTFASEEERDSCINIDPKNPTREGVVDVSLSLDELRAIVVRGCIAAIQKRLKEPLIKGAGAQKTSV